MKQPHLAACSALWFAAGLATDAGAAEVYKCTIAGKLSYSDMPCPAGASAAATLELPAALPAAPAARDGGARDLARQNKEAATLAGLRHRREEQDGRESDRLARQAAAQRKRCGKLKLDQQWANDDVRRATMATIDSARLRARRAADTLALECGK